MATKKQKPKKPVPPGPAEPEARLCRIAKFTYREVHRRLIKMAAYNPRSMQDEAETDLGKNIDKFGIVEALVWNERSGNLVGGHQRIKKIDKEEADDNFKVGVCVVDLDDKSEKELNIALNNPNLQGDYDLAKLGPMFLNKEVDIPNTGFSPAQVYQMFGDNPMVEQPEQLEVLGAQMREARERYDKIKKAAGKRDDMEYYLVVFASVEDRTAFLEAAGLPNNRFVDGRKLSKLLPALEKKTD